MLMQWEGKKGIPGQTWIYGEFQDSQGHIPRPPCLKTLKRKKKKDVTPFKSHAFRIQTSALVTSLFIQLPL